MATLIEIRDKADAKLVDFWAALVTKQDSYFTKHGKYFQLLVTNPVVDGVDTLFEVRHPNDELHQIDVDFTFVSPIPFKISVDEWQDTKNNEAGYSATVHVKLLTGEVYTRSRNNLNVDSGWSLVTEIT